MASLESETIPNQEEQSKPLDQKTVEKATVTCHHCCEDIFKGATICHHCKQFQTWLDAVQSWPIAVPMVGVVLTCLSVVLGYRQYSLARDERAKAQEAMRHVGCVGSILTELVPAARNSVFAAVDQKKVDEKLKELERIVHIIESRINKPLCQ